jgi:C4-dicarboxylate-specific signal transduction histidine kinase
MLHSAVLASIHDQIAVLDQDGVIIGTNQSWRRFVEESDSQWFQRAYVGSQYLEICAAAALSGDAIAAELLKATRAVLTGLTARQRMEFAHAATEASHRWYEISIERLQRAEGGAVALCADITAEKRAMSEAREQRRQLAHLGRAAILGELSGAFAHEPAQPLTSILGNAEAALQLLPQRDDLGEIREILRDIIKDDMRAAEVITRLRSMLTQGEIHREPIDLNQVVQEVLALARSDLVTRNVAVRLQLEPRDAPRARRPCADAAGCANLIINACEAMSEVPINERQVCISTRNIGAPNSNAQSPTAGAG